MAKSKKKNSSLFGIFSSGRKKKKRKTKAQALAEKQASVARIKMFSVIFAAVFTAAGVCIGFFYLDKYVHKSSPVAIESGPLVIAGKPDWFSSELASEIRKTAGGSEFRLDKKAASTVAEKLINLNWLSDLKVQTMKDSLTVYAKYRKPVATITVSGRKYYVDEELEAFKYVPVPKLAIVKITGTTLKKPDDAVLQEDIAAAVKLIMLLQGMDKGMKEKEDMPPLLNDIASIDVSNLNGRKSTRKSHITFYTRDDTPIYWGMQFGKTTGQIEATDQQKLAKLYNFYREKNTLLARKVKLIELRYPR